MDSVMIGANGTDDSVQIQIKPLETPTAQSNWLIVVGIAAVATVVGLIYFLKKH